MYPNSMWEGCSWTQGVAISLKIFHIDSVHCIKVFNSTSVLSFTPKHAPATIGSLKLRVEVVEMHPLANAEYGWVLPTRSCCEPESTSNTVSRLAFT